MQNKRIKDCRETRKTVNFQRAGLFSGGFALKPSELKITHPF